MNTKEILSELIEHVEAHENEKTEDMKTDNLLILIVGIALLLLLTRKPIKKALSRGYRNNNPGNIVLTFKSGKPFFWTGEIKGTDKRFKKFRSMEYGYRAIFITLRSYIGKGVNTIEKIINRYAPPHENVTSSYVKHVSEETGIPINKVVSMSDISKIKAIVKSISRIENGIKPDVSQIEAGYKLFAG